jgi:hypothetical protein
MGLAPSGQHENTANLLYAEVPVPVYSHRERGRYGSRKVTTASFVMRTTCFRSCSISAEILLRPEFPQRLMIDIAGSIPNGRLPAGASSTPHPNRKHHPCTRIRVIGIRSISIRSMDPFGPCAPSAFNGSSPSSCRCRPDELPHAYSRFLTNPGSGIGYFPSLAGSGDSDSMVSSAMFGANSCSQFIIWSSVIT